MEGGNGMIRGQREHRDQERVLKCSPRMVEEREEEKERWRDCREEG